MKKSFIIKPIPSKAQMLYDSLPLEGKIKMMNCVVNPNFIDQPKGTYVQYNEKTLLDFIKRQKKMK